MRKFEEYIIKIRLKANLDRLVVMHAILMIWKTHREVFFFFLLKEIVVIVAIVQRYCSKVEYSFC